jgi:hypothetical protein
MLALNFSDDACRLSEQLAKQKLAIGKKEIKIYLKPKGPKVTSQDVNILGFSRRWLSWVTSFSAGGSSCDVNCTCSD